MPRKISKEQAAQLGLVPVEQPRTAADILREKRDRAAGIVRSAASGPPSAEDTSAAGQWLGREGEAAVDKMGHNLRAFGSGITSNALPYLQAAGDVAVPFVLGQGPLVDGFNQALSRRKAEARKSIEEAPAANIAGAVAQPTPYGKATAAQRILAAGSLGALSNYLGGDAEDPQRPAEALEAGATGAGMQGLAELASPALGRFSKALRGWSGGHAIRAAGARAGITDKIAKMGYRPEDLPDLGNRFMDEGLIPTGLNPLRNPIEQTAARAQALQSRAGNKIGGELELADRFAQQRLDDTAAAFASAQAAPPGFPGALARSRWDEAKKLPPAGFDFPRAAERVDFPLDTAAKKTAAGKRDQLVREVLEQGTPEFGASPGGIGSYVKANKLKSDAYRNVDWKNEAPLSAELHRRGTGELRGAIEEQVGEHLGSDAVGRLRKANQQWGTAADADLLATNAISRGEQRQPFGLLRSAVGGLAGGGLAELVGGGLGGAGVGVATGAAINNAILSRGPNLAARAYRGGSRAARAAQPINQSPAGSAAAGNLLEQYLFPKDDEERQEDGAAWLMGR